MKENTKSVLREMGINSFDSTVTYPKAIGLLNLTISVQWLGNTCRVFCRGGLPEYDLIRSHCATRIRFVNAEQDIREVNGVPYLSLPVAKLKDCLRSIAHFRIMASGKARQVKRHQLVTSKLAQRWIAQLPVESELLPAVAMDDLVESF